MLELQIKFNGIYMWHLVYAFLVTQLESQFSPSKSFEIGRKLSCYCSARGA